MKKLLSLILFLVGATALQAQCTTENTAFQAGEALTYNLYYNWQFVWVKAGTASMTTAETTYKGANAYKTSLTTKSNGRLDNMFVLRDTLLAYYTHDLAPLYYRKGAREGKRYYVDEAFYSYPEGKCQAKMHQIKNDGTHHWNTQTLNDCIYDMVCIFMRARSLSDTGIEAGHTFNFTVVDGTKTIIGRLRFSGRTTVKADNGKRYNCLQLSYSEVKKGKTKKIADFYVTDDRNHVPVRIDLHLKFGSAKAYLTQMRGLRNPVTSEKK